ncbi:hypothetical protein B0T17DRAFT_596903 [Bombardia bombarda]|uniref:Uncharacterized protein n=1 Tax=Bombardia bombarda TaxID=252184 RepID=A0AA40C7Q9_9PEZI|nr:hypothetical protein B0T17DRAFT_596903 [Bombardia bombarda]
MNKRDTIFPGSHQWTERFSPESVSPSTPKARLPELPTRADSQGGRLRRINLPVKSAGSYGDRSVPVIEGSPWKHYRNAYGLELGGSVAVVCKTPATKQLFALHSFSGSSREKKLYMLRQLKHENLLSPEEIFSFENSFYVISEYTAISLEGFILVRPDEVQLAAIVHQNLAHGSITCSTVLLTTEGVVKIANPENCSAITPENRLADTKALGLIMSNLMDEGSEEGMAARGSAETTLRLRNPRDWSAEAIDFLTLTMTASASKLAEHPFLGISPQDLGIILVFGFKPRLRAIWP